MKILIRCGCFQTGGFARYTCHEDSQYHLCGMNWGSSCIHEPGQCHLLGDWSAEPDKSSWGDIGPHCTEGVGAVLDISPSPGAVIPEMEEERMGIPQAGRREGSSRCDVEPQGTSTCCPVTLWRVGTVLGPRTGWREDTSPAGRLHCG